MNQETPEDRTILAALDAPDGGLGTSTSGLPKTARDETAETLARLYTEVLGLLPYELEPQAPRPELKQRLMAALTAAPPAAAREAEESEPVLPAPAPVPAPPPAAEPAPPPPAAPVAPAGSPERRPSGEVRIPRPAPIPAPVPLSDPPRRWPLALAASLALILAGLSGVLGYLVSEQRTRMENLEAELSKARAAEERARRAEARAERAWSDMQRMREGFNLVVNPNATVMPLRPMGDPAPQPEAKGVLFVAADHQHWHLSIHRLRPAERDQAYQLWFVTHEGRVVSGGTFNPRFGQAVSLSSPTMPEDTKEAKVTLEPATGSISPTGPSVLFGDAGFDLL